MSLVVARGLAGLDASERLAYCERISGSRFFQTVYAEVITTLYNDPEVW